MSGPTAFCQYRQKVQNRPGGIPLSLSGILPNWVYCMHVQTPKGPLQLDVLHVRNAKKGALVQQEPDLECSHGELRSGSVTLIPLPWGSHGVEIRACKETWRFLVTLAKSCTFPPYKKKPKHILLTAHP